MLNKFYYWKQSWIDWSCIHSIKLEAVLTDCIILFLDVFSNHELHIPKAFFFVNSYQDWAIIFTRHQIGSNDIVKLWKAKQVVFHIWAI